MAVGLHGVRINTLLPFHSPSIMGSKERRGTLFGSYMIWGTKSAGAHFSSPMYMGTKRPKSVGVHFSSPIYIWGPKSVGVHSFKQD